MIVTKKYIQDLREKSFLNISKEIEQRILDEFGEEFVLDEEGYYREYTEQDIWENIRKML
ncbi:MAG: hypothetical protein F8N39_12510 [Clostridiaceae bacterium]|nr:hypothetical protein [Clostridiaceae bacterium]